MLGVAETRVCALFRAGGGSLVCGLGAVSFCLVRFCGGAPASHSVQSRLRASMSERVCTHVVVCRLSGVVCADCDSRAVVCVVFESM